jgi:DeoR/GlpR family transcriptional regulator of sugar metabolism
MAGLVRVCEAGVIDRLVTNAPPPPAAAAAAERAGVVITIAG